MNKKQGIIVVVSGPSGAGKGTVCKCLTNKNPGIFLSVSATSRQQAEGEIDGQTYYYLTEDDFKARIKNNEFLEWATYNGNYYGTLKEKVENQTAQGNDVILEIDVQGAMQIKKTYPHAVLVFILPPSWQELEKRLIDRNREDMEQIQKRLETARKEIPFADKYNYIIVNDDLETATKELESVITAEKVKAQSCKNIVEQFKNNI